MKHNHRRVLGNISQKLMRRNRTKRIPLRENSNHYRANKRGKEETSKTSNQDKIPNELIATVGTAIIQE